MKKQPQKNLPSCLSNRVKDKRAYEQYYNEGSTRAIRKVLAEELMSRIEQACKESESKEKFDLPAWMEYQASNIGYRRALRELIRLLDK